MEIATSLLRTLMGASPLINRRVNCRVRLSEYKPTTSILAPDSYSVYSLVGKSEIARNYEYTIIFVSDEPIPVESISDTLCEITLRDEIKPLSHKKIAGRISHAKENGSVGRKHLYEITIVSPLYYLSLNRRSEIYMDKSVSDIISTLIKRYSALLNLNLIVKTDPLRYPVRHYTTQYEQSDYEFITMLCEEEGIVLLLDETTSEPFTLTLCELTPHAPSHTTPIEATYNLQKAFNVSTQHHDYYDPSKPSLDMSHTSKSTTSFLKDNSSTTQLRSELTRHSLKDRLDTLEGTLAKDLNRYGTLNAERSYTPNELITGISQELELKEGINVTLNDTKVFKQTNAIILSVHYNGFFPNALDELINDEHDHKEQYTATFRAIPADVTYRPPYTITKPRIDGVHTARVSKGDQELTKGANEIDVNEKGEIRVIMHFDPNYPTTCYIPLNTLYAGDHYGMRFLPRVNSEVLISYINGNIDRPIIIGMLHNGEKKVNGAARETTLGCTIPYDLPNTKTQSYIKTQTTPQYTDTEGYNEILFEDANSNEQFNMRAQKDYSLLVLHDATEHIQHDRSETVDNNEDVTIHGYRTERVNKSKTETIDIAKALTIGAGYQVSVGASKNETVGISSTEEVGVLKSTIVGEEYTITVGNSIIHMSAEGTIEITASNIQVSASEYVEIKGKKVCVNGGCEGEKKAKAVSVQSDEDYDQHFELVDEETGKPLANVKYRLTASTGEILEGISDKNGFTEKIATQGEADITVELI